jgi:Zn-dependent peptidase ImmA (M78 family)
MAATPNPWAVLAGTDLILVRWAIPEPGRYYHSRGAIVVRQGLRLVEERSVLWHELVHAVRGDRRCDTDRRDEARCHSEAARWAIPLDSLGARPH